MIKKDKRTRKGENEADQDTQPEASESPAQAEAQPQAADQGELASLRAERDDLLARLQRVSADYMNYQKRVQRDTSMAREFANEELMKSLLGVLDDMERALQAARENRDQDDALLKGMQLVHDKAVETLGKFGLRAIEAVGKTFNPDKHSAMMQEPSAEHPPMTVIRELQKGYELKGRTLRPSAVVVATAPQAAQEPSDQGKAAPQKPDQDERKPRQEGLPQ